jgi:hypothetical protein
VREADAEVHQREAGRLERRHWRGREVILHSLLP